MSWSDPLGMLVGFFKAGTPTLVEDTEPLPVNPDRFEFSRISEKRYKDTEEVRFDIPVVLTSASIYVGVAPDGTLTSAASWTVIRSYFDANSNPNRQRIRFNVVWDTRTAGWT